jgi:threonine aldolase
MNFASDNTTGAHPRIVAAVAAAAGGRAMPYGNDEITRRVERRFAELFEHDCAVFLVGTGTAANSLALAALTPPWGSVFCHPEGHINTDECGAPEFYMAGAKLVGVPGRNGKVAAQDIHEAVSLAGAGSVHHVQPAAVSLTQATEAGTVYRAEELGSIGEICRRHKLGFHVDGARFANAVASANVAPADLTWRAGVDVISFGATKNGAIAAEAIVVFDKEKAETIGFRRKRAGQLWSKHRFLAAQLDAYLADDLWLTTARHANAMATRMADGLARVPGASFRDPVEANEIFVRLPEASLQGLERDGFVFYRWPGADRQLIRLVTAYDTAAADVDGFVASALRHAS